MLGKRQQKSSNWIGPLYELRTSKSHIPLTPRLLYLSTILAQGFLFLFLWRAFMATLASFFGWRKPSKKELQNTVTLSWGKQRFDVSFKRQNLDLVTLKEFKLQCKELTGVPVANMKLTVSGGKWTFYCHRNKTTYMSIIANLKDDTASLASCGIQGGSTVILTGEKVNVCGTWCIQWWKRNWL